jgi:hypothetical protein
LNWLLANYLKDLSGGLLLYGCHYHYWDPSCAYALFIERVARIGIGCILPKSLILFAARFMSDVCLDLTANRAHGARIGFQVEVPGWILSLSPVGCDEGKRIWVALIADAKQGKGSRQSTFGAGGGQVYYGQSSEGTCQSRPTTTQFEGDVVKVMQVRA